MKLQAKVLLLLALSAACITAAVGALSFLTIRDESLGAIRANMVGALRHVASSVESFFADVRADVAFLAADPAVRVRDEAGFTNFLGADERTFEYRIGPRERAIIDVFARYRATHPEANSVYMGRVGGAFVRSHPRDRPTAYDPRDRPWYLAALARPGEAALTDAYPSVTNGDLNVGVVKALVGADGAVYGVVGVDVTLARLTRLVEAVGTEPGGKVLIADDKGRILAGAAPAFLLKDAGEYAPDLAFLSPGAAPGRTTDPMSVSVAGERCYAYALDSAALGWRLAMLVPAANVEAPIAASILRSVAATAAGALLASILLLAGIGRFVVGPLKALAAQADRIAADPGRGERVAAGAGDEVGALAAAFNRVLGAVEAAGAALGAAERRHREGLEADVARRTAELRDANAALSAEVEVRRRAEEGLGASEAKYRELVERANSIIIRWDRAGTIRFANEYALRFFGYAAGELEGRNIVGTILPADAAGELPARVFADPEAYAANENENVKRGGERAWVAWTNRPIRDSAGAVVEILSVGNDVTERRAAASALERTLGELTVAKERAESADRLKSAFLATMSHELRTPLNSIIGFTGIILQGLVGPLNEEQAKQLGMVRGSAQHLLALINDILEISKIEAGQLALADEAFPLREAVERAFETARPLAAAKGLSYTLDAPGDLGTLRGDRRRLEQVLLNLISNAVKFTESGSVAVACGRADGRASFRVVDTGIGLGPEDRDKLFKPFSQIDTGLTRKYEGTGLGLSICKRLVELMGGEVWVRSERGTGSEFGFSVPAPEGEG